MVTTLTACYECVKLKAAGSKDVYITQEVKDKYSLNLSLAPYIVIAMLVSAIVPLDTHLYTQIAPSL